MKIAELITTEFFLSNRKKKIPVSVKKLLLLVIS